jgi:hypothetical protein
MVFFGISQMTEQMTDKPGLNIPALMCVCGALLVFVSYFLPWVGISGKKSEPPVMSKSAYQLNRMQVVDSEAVCSAISKEVAAKTYTQYMGLSDTNNARIMLDLLLDKGTSKPALDSANKLRELRLEVRKRLFEKDLANQLCNDIVKGEVAEAEISAREFAAALDVVRMCGEKDIAGKKCGKAKLFDAFSQSLSPGARTDFEEIRGVLNELDAFLRSLGERDVARGKITKLQMYRKYAATLDPARQKFVNDALDEVESIFAALHGLGDRNIFEGKATLRDALVIFAGNLRGGDQVEVNGVMREVDALFAPITDELACKVVKGETSGEDLCKALLPDFGKATPEQQEAPRRIADTLLLFDDADVNKGARQILGTMYVNEVMRRVTTQSAVGKLRKMCQYYDAIQKAVENDFTGDNIAAWRRDSIESTQFFNAIRHERVLGRLHLLGRAYDEVRNAGPENMTGESIRPDVFGALFGMLLSQPGGEPWAGLFSPYFKSSGWIEALLKYGIPEEMWLCLRPKHFDSWFMNDRLIRAYAEDPAVGLTVAEKEALLNAVDNVKFAFDTLNELPAQAIIEGTATREEALRKAAERLAVEADRKRVEVALNWSEAVTLVLSAEDFFKDTSVSEAQLAERILGGYDFREATDQDREIIKKNAVTYAGMVRKAGAEKLKDENELKKLKSNFLVPAVIELTSGELRKKLERTAMMYFGTVSTWRKDYLIDGRIPQYGLDVIVRNILLSPNELSATARDENKTVVSSMAFRKICAYKKNMFLRLFAAVAFFDMLRNSSASDLFVQEELTPFVNQYFTGRMDDLTDEMLRDVPGEVNFPRRGMAGFVKELTEELRKNRKDDPTIETVCKVFAGPKESWPAMPGLVLFKGMVAALKAKEKKLLGAEMPAFFEVRVNRYVDRCAESEGFSGALIKMCSDAEFVADLQEKIMDIKQDEFKTGINSHVMDWFDKAIVLTVADELLGRRDFGSLVDKLSETNPYKDAYTPAKKRALKRAARYLTDFCKERGDFTGMMMSLDDVGTRDEVNAQVAAKLDYSKDQQGVDFTFDMLNTSFLAGDSVNDTAFTLNSAQGSLGWTSKLWMAGLALMVIALAGLFAGAAGRYVVTALGIIGLAGVYVLAGKISSLPADTLIFAGIGPALAVAGLLLIVVVAALQLPRLSLKQSVVLIGALVVVLGYFLPWSAQMNNPDLSWRTGWQLVAKGYSFEAFWGSFKTTLFVIFPVLAAVCFLMALTMRSGGWLFLVAITTMSLAAGMGYCVGQNQLQWGSGMLAVVAGFGIILTGNVFGKQIQQAPQQAQNQA